MVGPWWAGGPMMGRGGPMVEQWRPSGDAVLNSVSYRQWKCDGPVFVPSIVRGGPLWACSGFVEGPLLGPCEA